MTERLQKVLAAAGYGSRRACEEIILAGRVRVNGRIAATLPVLVDPERDAILVDQRRIQAERKVYYLLNKPKNVFCTQYDPSGRKRAVDLLEGIRERVYPVGRLDADSRGLLLMTNDGDLAARLTHPRYGIPKTYRAWLPGRITPENLELLRRGIWLSGGKTQPAQVKLIYGGAMHSVIELTLHEGRNRQVRRMLAKLGHRVRDLIRISIGPLSLRGLGVGRCRPLLPKEVEELRRWTSRVRPKAAGTKPGPVIKKSRPVRAEKSVSEATPVRPRIRPGTGKVRRRILPPSPES